MHFRFLITPHSSSPPTLYSRTFYSNYILLSKDTPPSLSRCRALDPRSPSSSRCSPLTSHLPAKKHLEPLHIFAALGIFVGLALLVVASCFIYIRLEESAAAAVARKEAEERDLLELLCCPVCEGKTLQKVGGKNNGGGFICEKCGESVSVVEPSWVRRKIEGMVDDCRRLWERVQMRRRMWRRD
jgi:hypothetical protein